MGESTQGDDPPPVAGGSQSDGFLDADQQELFPRFQPFPPRSPLIGDLDGYEYGIRLNYRDNPRVYYNDDAARMRHRTVFVKVDITIPQLNGELAVSKPGTGFFIADDVILLARHTLTSRYAAQESYTRSISIHLGKSESANYPGLKYKALHAAHSITPGLDIAVLIVASRQGSPALGMQISAYQKSPRVTLAGYAPFHEARGVTYTELTYAEGRVLKDYYEHGVQKIAYAIDTLKADSGAPLYVMDGSNQPVAVGIHIEGKSPGIPGNVGLAFNTEVIKEIDFLVQVAKRGQGNVRIS